MPLILDGSLGVSGVDGSAGTPSLQGTDNNTGVFYGTDIVGISTGGSERMRIDSSGNVGIGTISPSVKLQLQSGVFHITDGTQTLRQGVTTGFGFVGMQSNHALVLFTNDAERMRIDSSGNVGIGTSSPVARLDIISNTARMYFSNQSATAFITAVNTTNSAYAPMAINGSEMILKTGDAERMRINSSGNVGIGTSSPTQSLDVAGNITGNDYIIRATAGTIGYTGANGAGIEIYGSSSGTPNIVTVRTSNAERMRIDSAGNVGIGTSSITRAFANYNQLNINGTSGATIQMQSNGSLASNIVADTTALYIQNVNALSFGTGGTGTGTERMRIDSGGTISATGLFVGRSSAATDVNTANDIGSFSVRGSPGTVASISFHRTGAYAINMGLGTDNVFRIGGWSAASNCFQLDGSGNGSFRGALGLGSSLNLPVNGAIEAAGGTIFSSTIYNSTTAAGASVSITGVAAALQRSVSSIKYKTNVEDIEPARTKSIYEMRPVWYRSKCDTDRKDWSYYGLIAEELAEIEPRLVHWSAPNEEGVQEPEGVMYDRLTVLLLAEMKELKATVDAQAAKIAELEAKLK